jgi:hypothetical protein
MNTISASHRFPVATHSLLPWLVLGGLTAARWTCWPQRSIGPGGGFEPVRSLRAILQAIASWVLGRDQAVAGGWATALAGALLHYGLMIAMVAGFHAASVRWPRLLQRPLQSGALYGAFLYVLMFKILVPHFSAVQAHKALPTELDVDLLPGLRAAGGNSLRAVRARGQALSLRELAPRACAEMGLVACHPWIDPRSRPPSSHCDDAAGADPFEEIAMKTACCNLLALVTLSVVPVHAEECKPVHADLVEVFSTEGCNPGLTSCYWASWTATTACAVTTHFRGNSSGTAPSGCA